MYAELIKNSRWGWVVYLIPNLLTTGNIFCGLFSILSVFHGHYKVAAIAITIALVFDILDGRSARWMHSTSQFGVEYDSLADLVSFGVAPALLMYGWSLNAYSTLGPSAVFIFVACGAFRLARFNTTTTTAENKYFTGLPIPAAASIVATIVIFDSKMIHFGIADNTTILLILTVTLAFLMVSTVRYHNFKNFKAGNFLYFDGLILLAIIMVIIWPYVVPLVIFACYVVSGPIGTLLWLFHSHDDDEAISTGSQHNR